MKIQPTLRYLRAMLTLCIAAMTTMAHAAPLTIPGANGSDGALNITVSTNIDLGLASTGPWDTNNTANAGNGVYDADKWAVVFKYTSVNIANGATVTFKNHPSRAPVVWLVSGDVMIDGVVSLDANNVNTVNPPEGGPGGFRGGGRNAYGAFVTSCFGPGGGYGNSDTANGHFGQNLPGSYGRATLIPLIGGSGGSGYSALSSGSGGGGAILIAASQTLALSGTIRANTYNNSGIYGKGSGGAIRLVADEIQGTGSVEAVGHNGYDLGKTRLQANSVSAMLSVTPSSALESPTSVVLWPEPSAPAVRVVSVSGQSAPTDPRANLENTPADLTVATTNAVTILLETANFPTNGTVNVFVKPRNASQSTYQATWISGTTNLSTWQLQRPVLPGYSVIQARAVAQ